MVKKYIVVGNGFDMNIGLKSSYQSFLNDMGEKYKLREPSDFYKFNPLFQKDINDNWSDFEGVFENLIFNANSIDDRKLACKEVDTYNQALERLELQFYTYLSREYRRWKQQIVSKVNPVYRSIFRDAKVFNFNYTNTLTDIELKDLADKVFQVHGSLENRNIIFGGGFLEHDRVSEIVLPNSTDNDKLVRIKKDHLLLKERDEMTRGVESDSEMDLYILGHSIAGTDLNFLSKLIEKARKIYLFYYKRDYSEKMQTLLQNFKRDVVEKVQLIPFVDVLVDKEQALEFNLSGENLSEEEKGEEELLLFQKLFNLNIPKNKEFEKIWITVSSLECSDIRSIQLKSDADCEGLEWILKFIEFGEIDEGKEIPIEFESVRERVGFPTLIFSDSFKALLRNCSELRIKDCSIFIDDLFDSLKESICSAICIWDSRLTTVKESICLSDFPNLEEIEIQNSTFTSHILPECEKEFHFIHPENAQLELKVNVDSMNLIKERE